MSVVVLQELIVGAPDSTSVTKYETLKRHYEDAGKLLVPTADDWVLAGRILNALLRGKKSKHRGKTPRLPDSEKQRIVRDVLIARSVKRIGATLVTNNLKDFNEIHRFCSLRIKSGSEFFSS
jgi:predicted nucleic acid-binding protein